MSGVCSISRHRLSATGATSGKPKVVGLALDVVRGAEQRVARSASYEAARHRIAMRAASSRLHS